MSVGLTGKKPRTNSTRPVSCKATPKKDNNAVRPHAPPIAVSSHDTRDLHEIFSRHYRRMNGIDFELADVSFPIREQNPKP